MSDNGQQTLEETKAMFEEELPDILGMADGIADDMRQRELSNISTEYNAAATHCDIVLEEKCAVAPSEITGAFNAVAPDVIIVPPEMQNAPAANDAEYEATTAPASLGM